MRAVNALLVDDHALFREGLALLMSQRFPEVNLWQADDLAQARQMLAAHPDIELVLLDLNLRDSQGLDSLRALREAAPELPVVAMSADNSAEVVEAVIAQGGAGFIPKVARGQVIEQALRVVLDGGTYLPSETLMAARAQGAASRAARLDEGGDSADSFAAAAHEAFDLSPRQQDVLRGLVQGKPNKIIARDLDIAQSSVKSHMAVIFKKLGVNSRAEAVLLALRSGLDASA